MKIQILKPAARLFACAALALSSQITYAQPVLFSDDFAVNSSSSWLIYSNSTDFKAQFAFAYTTNKFVRGGVTNTIPLAPSSLSSAETNGLKLTVNDTLATVVAINLYPVGQVFSNDYTLKFDMWLNYTGSGFGTGTGGTEDAIFGINHVGDKNVFSATGSTLSSPVGDGLPFAVDTDGDYSRDYQAFVGDNANPLLELQGADVGFLDRDGDSNPETESNALLPSTSPLKLMFPSPTFESAGMPSKQWVRVEIRQRTNDVGGYIVTWLIDGYVIAEHPFATTFGQISGDIMIGMMDPFAGIGTPLQDSFMIYDNVRVLDLSGVPPNEVVSIAATDPSATEPSGDDGVITISRTGSTDNPLIVPFRTAGTATRGTDYVTQTNGVTFTTTNVVIPAGASSVDVTIHVLDDNTGESTESAILVLAGNPNAYDIRESISAEVDITDNADLPVASISTFRPGAYEGNTNNYGVFQVTFSTPYSLGDVTVNYTTSGTAVNGTHYESIGSSLVMPAGTTTNFIYILPIQNADTVSNRIATLTLTSGSGYFLSTNSAATNASITIFNDDLPTATGTLFSDNFDTDTTPNWNVNASSAGDAAAFAYDYSQIGVPPAPHSIGGTTLGVQIRANSPVVGGTAVQSGISISPKNQSFTGDYRLRFDMWLNVTGPFPLGGAGSTQIGTAGITSGNVAQWASSTVSSNWVLFGCSTDGNNATDYRVYCPTGGPAGVGAQITPDTGVYSAGTTSAAQQNTAQYYAVFGPQGAPASQLAINGAQSGLLAPGVLGMAWHDVVITKLGNTLTWDVDGLRLATINAYRFGTVLSTNVFVGMFDVNGTRTTVALDSLLCNIVDNLVVESLPAPTIPVITNIAITSGTSVQVDFNGGVSDFPAVFLLLSSTNVAGPYVNLNANLTQLSPGVFRAVTPYTTDGARFYRILR